MSIEVPGKEILIVSSDNFSLYPAFICTAISCAVYFILAFKRKYDCTSRISRFARGAYYVSVGSLGYASLYLLTQILSLARYDIEYIYQNSGPGDELIYRISAFWAGQEGSLLLWALFTGVTGIFLVRKFHSHAPSLLSFWCLIQSCMTLLLLKSDPFVPIENYQLGTVGVGLNPLLKNPWMAIHPPVVFIGYALLIVPAALAVWALIRGDMRGWANDCLPWALFGWVSLSAGLILGMVWSYQVLGWGGYWGWDPVENASLIPWITSTALVHGLLVQRYRNRLAHLNIILSIITFLLILYATFLTRSGVLADASVHSFSDSDSYVYLLTILLAFSVLSIGLIAFRWRAVKTNAGEMRADSREFITTVGVVVLMLFGAVVLAGTSFPLLKKGSLDSSFYTHMSLPIAIAISLLIAIAPIFKWGRRISDRQISGVAGGVLMSLLAIPAVAIISAVICLKSPALSHKLFSWLVSHDSKIFATAVPIVLFAVLASAVALIVSIIAIGRKSLIRSGGYIAHVGVALMILGIAFSSAGTSKKVLLTMGDAPKSVFGYEISYIKRFDKGPEKEFVRLLAMRNGKKIPMTVETRTTDRNIIHVPHIEFGILGDLYVSPQDQGDIPIRTVISLVDGDLKLSPVNIPGTKESIVLVGMQVEDHSAKFRYTSESGKVTEFIVGKNQYVDIDGRRMKMLGIFMDQSSMNNLTAGADLVIIGNEGVFDISRKPMISLLWLGTILLILGGTIATVRRVAENKRENSGKLSDNSESE